MCWGVMRRQSCADITVREAAQRERGVGKGEPGRLRREESCSRSGLQGEVSESGGGSGSGWAAWAAMGSEPASASL